MGLQAKCKALFEGNVSDGNAVLESEELIFRGKYRISVPFKAIKRLSEAAGKLSIESDQGMLVLSLERMLRSGKTRSKIQNPCWKS